jgi:hypothetical protein
MSVEMISFGCNTTIHAAVRPQVASKKKESRISIREGNEVIFQTDLSILDHFVLMILN